jgi:hypothetical protein
MDTAFGRLGQIPPEWLGRRCIPLPRATSPDVQNSSSKLAKFVATALCRRADVSRRQCRRLDRARRLQPKFRRFDADAATSRPLLSVPFCKMRDCFSFRGAEAAGLQHSAALPNAILREAQTWMQGPDVLERFAASRCELQAPAGAGCSPQQNCSATPIK